jgi:hypothetical protein
VIHIYFLNAFSFPFLAAVFYLNIFSIDDLGLKENKGFIPFALTYFTRQATPFAKLHFIRVSASYRAKPRFIPPTPHTAAPLQNITVYLLSQLQLYQPPWRRFTPPFCRRQPPLA